MFIFDYVRVSWNKNSLSFDNSLWSEMNDTDKWQLYNHFWSFFAMFSMTCQLLVVFLFSSSFLANFLKKTTLWSSRFVGFKFFKFWFLGVGALKVLKTLPLLQWGSNFFLISVTVFPHIIAAATILFWTHLVRKLFKFSFPLCNENLNSFLTRWGN